MSDADLLKRTADLALEFLEGLPGRRVGPRAGVEELRAALGGPLPERGEDPLHGVAAMRISVSNWSTTAADIDASAEAILLQAH